MIESLKDGVLRFKPRVGFTCIYFGLPHFFYHPHAPWWTCKDGGRGADVTFLVKGEAICAHSQILLARSDVFASELLGGMQESISKEIVVEDCEGEIFKAMLRFLYTEPWNPWNLHTPFRSF